MAYDRILKRFRECVRRRDYALTTHAEEEMAADGFTVFDVESGALTGAILQKQKDAGTAESKYRLRGITPGGEEIELVAKFGAAGTMIIITVYAP